MSIYARVMVVVLLLVGTLAAWSVEEEGAWKTAYFKRGFVGNYEVKWAGGVGATLRMRVPILFAGTKVRVYLRGSRNTETKLAKMALVRGVDDQGKIAGPQFPVLFAGQPTFTLNDTTKEAISDPLNAPITPGTWYLQDCYTSEKFPYAYDVDREFTEAGDRFAAETLTGIAKCRLGATYRIDVFTTDKRPTVVCYGDSITHGYNSTPNAGCRYPDILAKLLDRPTLNLGVNGDVVIYAGGMPSLVGSLNGVDTVVFMMGINDIIRNAQFNKDAYVTVVRKAIDGCHARKLKFYLGTIPPAGGYKAFDTDPAKEALRQEINGWIRAESGADGVIDFDATLADPQHPSAIKAEYQSGDWLHPNDLGYQKMAEAAAQVIGAKK